MNYLIFGDLHITQSSLKECAIILDEITTLITKYNIDTIISLGDTFDSLEPSSSELDLLSDFIKKINIKVILLAADSHESTTQKESIINHFGILNDMVTVVKELKIDNHLYCGHFILKEAKKNFGAKLSKENFKQYLYVFLGHQHSYELIKPNCVQLGSSRFVNFDEAQDKQKIVALISDYGTEGEQVRFLKLKSPIPMIELKLYKNTSKEAPGASIPAVKGDTDNKVNKAESSISQAQTSQNTSQIDLLCQQLDKLDSNTKVKVKIGDFESFKAFLPLEGKYKEKFVKFVRENDFELISDKPLTGAKSEIDLKQSFEEFTKEKQIDNEIKDIINKEIK